MSSIRQFQPAPSRPSGRSRRDGMASIYALIGMTAMCGVALLAVDYARVQLVKTELQRTADAAVRTAALSVTEAQSDADTRYYAQYVASAHTADGKPVLIATTDVQFGKWNPLTAKFTPQATSVGANAVQVTAGRTAARGSAVPLMWGRLFAKSACDVTVSSVARFVPAQVKTITIDATKADPWLAGMPAGSTASYNDTAPDNAPPELGITLTPGSYITFDNATGSAGHGPATTMDGPDGNSGKIKSHGADSPGGATPADENGIADVVMPIDAILGVFLNDDAPNASAAPGRRDYTTAASRDNATYDDIELKQPFFIGNGLTGGGTVQQFRVPQGATRLFLGTMDGHEWANNVGSFTVTIHIPRAITLVR